MIVDHHVLAERIAIGKQPLGRFRRKHAIVSLGVEIGLTEEPTAVDDQPRHLGVVGRAADAATLEQILVEPKNALIKQYHKMFRIEGVELEVREQALRAIARKALARKTGARGLRSILEQVLLDVMYDLPSLSNLARCVVDESTITNDGKPLLMFSASAKAAHPAARSSAG
jgi:hypothetical protein